MSEQVTANYDLNTKQLYRALHVLVQMKRPVMVWGPPGLGKSDVSRAIARNLGMHYHDVRALLLDPVDLRGIPWRDPETGMTRWAPPAFLPSEQSTEAHLVNLEELPNAMPATQSALYQLVLDRMVGEYRLPDGAALIACGNRVNDRGGAHRMPAPLANRFTHLTLKSDVDSWVDWAIGQNGLDDDIPTIDLEPLRKEKEAGERICIETIFYMQLRPDALNKFEPSKQANAFPTSRTWEMASDFYRLGGSGDEDVDLAIQAGTVGEGHAVDFYAFLEIWRQLPHPDTVFNDPHNTMIPPDESAKVALAGALCHSVTQDDMEALCIYGGRLRVELAEFMIGQTIKTKPECAKTRAYAHWAAARSRV